MQASELFCQNILKHGLVQRQIVNDPLQLGILLLELP